MWTFFDVVTKNTNRLHLLINKENISTEQLTSDITTKTKNRDKFKDKFLNIFKKSNKNNIIPKREKIEIENEQNENFKQNNLNLEKLNENIIKENKVKVIDM